MAWFLMCTLLVTEILSCFVTVGELAWLLVWTLLVTQRPVLFQRVSWPVFNGDTLGDTDCGLSCLVCELSWFLMWTLLVTKTVACLISGSELARFSM